MDLVPFCFSHYPVSEHSGSDGWELSSSVLGMVWMCQGHHGRHPFVICSSWQRLEQNGTVLYVVGIQVENRAEHLKKKKKLIKCKRERVTENV